MEGCLLEDISRTHQWIQTRFGIDLKHNLEEHKGNLLSFLKFRMFGISSDT